MSNRIVLILGWVSGAIAVLAGCGPGVADFTRDLGGGYALVSTGPLQRYILAGEDYAVRNLVVDVDHDGEFIVSIRLAVREYQCEPGPTLTELITPEVEYWVIDKRKDRVYGPLSRADYGRLGLEMGFSDDLQLDEGRISEYLALAKQLNREARIKEGECRPFIPG
jgi:hypothetical protein